MNGKRSVLVSRVLLGQQRRRRSGRQSELCTQMRANYRRVKGIKENLDIFRRGGNRKADPTGAEQLSAEQSSEGGERFLPVVLELLSDELMILQERQTCLFLCS